jgi:Zn-dependent protease/predicted transcriptional regulator
MEPPQPPTSPTPEHPQPGRIQVGRILGVQVQVHWSLAFIFTLVLLNLGLSVFPSWHPEWGPLVTWVTASGAGVLFLASILCHEMSHSLVAEKLGIRVARITLFLFGGVSEMRDEPESPRTEFLVAVVGPLTSMAIGVAAAVAGTWGAEIRPFNEFSELGEAVRTMNPPRTLLLWLGPINLLLGAFNLVPGFPLDGGRVLRSALWWATGDIIRATRWAAGVGQLFGWILVFAGFMDLFGGSAAEGLWLVLIGWFLINAAGASYQHLFLGQTLGHVRVADIMREVTTLDPEIAVQTLVDDYLMRDDRLSYPVVLEGQLLGLVGLQHVQKVEREKWPWTRVGTIMTPRERLSTLDGTMTAARAAQTMAEHGVAELPVLEDGRLLGVVRQQDILRWIALHPGERNR